MYDLKNIVHYNAGDTIHFTFEIGVSCSKDIDIVQSRLEQICQSMQGFLSSVFNDEEV